MMLRLTRTDAAILAGVIEQTDRGAAQLLSAGHKLLQAGILKSLEVSDEHSLGRAIKAEAVNGSQTARAVIRRAEAAYFNAG